MPRLLRILVCTTLLACGVAPALAQTTAPVKPRSPGEMAAADKAMTEKRANCESEARAKKLSYFKRRQYVRGCLRR